MATQDQDSEIWEFFGNVPAYTIQDAEVAHVNFDD